MDDPTSTRPIAEGRVTPERLEELRSLLPPKLRTDRDPVERAVLAARIVMLDTFSKVHEQIDCVYLLGQLYDWTDDEINAVVESLPIYTADLIFDATVAHICNQHGCANPFPMSGTWPEVIRLAESAGVNATDR